MKQITFFVTLLTLLNAGQQLSAQVSHRCGTRAPSVRPASNEQLQRQAGARLMAPTLPLPVRIMVYIFTNNNGTSQACTEDEIRVQIENMQAFFQPHNICFILGGIQVVRNTTLNAMDADDLTSKTTLAGMASNNVITIFVHNTLIDDDGGLNGTAYNIPNSFLSIVSGAVQSTTNTSTLAHEMGHCLGLLHTFEDAYGSENAARSGDCKNCTEAGDLLCDTAADRDVDANTINASCQYIGPQLLDECDVTIPMEETNIMTYGRRACRSEFSPNQGTRMLATLILTYSNKLAEDVVTVQNGALSSGVGTYAARQTLTFSPAAAYTVSGSATVNGSSREINVNPGVTFTPGTDGYVHLKNDVLCP